MRTVTLRPDSIHKGSLVLISPSLPLRAEPDKDSLVPLTASDVLMERRAANMLKAAMAPIGGWNAIAAVSGFRTLREQQDIYQDSLLKSGSDFTCRYVALPGCSEHQTGLAVDLAEDAEDMDLIRPRFPDSGVCGRFKRKAPEYGFIERYPSGREHITHIAHEPWHFRYVGYPHSYIINRLGLTLEEYTAYLKRFRYSGEHLKCECGGRRFEIYFVPLGGPVSICVPDTVPCQTSGNNEDGAVITLWEGAL